MQYLLNILFVLQRLWILVVKNVFIWIKSFVFLAKATIVSNIGVKELFRYCIIWFLTKINWKRVSVGLWNV